MAKVSNPLMSVTASGVFGPIVYDIRGFARPRIKPTNPQTEEQGNVRQVLKATQKAVLALNDDAKSIVKAHCADLGYPQYRWNAALVGLAIGENGETANATRQEYGNLDNTSKTKLAQLATVNNITSTAIEYASALPITGGEALFIVLRALETLSDTITLDNFQNFLKETGN